MKNLKGFGLRVFAVCTLNERVNKSCDCCSDGI